MNLEALCKEAELSFYDDELVSENGRKIYRIYVQKEGGVNLMIVQGLVKFYRLFLM